MKFTFVLSALIFGYAMGQNVVEVAVGSPELFSTLVDLVVTTGLDEALSTTPDITVFAPTNDAFGKLNPSSLNLLKTDPWRPHLTNLLLQHVLPVEVPSSAITDGLTATALNGEDTKLNLPSPGVVVVDGHSNVIQPDVRADNGVIHVVDTVLFPDWVSNSVADRAFADSELTTLTNLITGLHVTNSLSFHGPYTIFAPTDDGFAEGLKVLDMEDGYIDAHTAGSLLTYHIVHGVYSAADITDGLELKTVQGDVIRFSFDGDVPQVNGENIITTDVLANNGVVHKIDGLLIPESVLPDGPADAGTVVDVAVSDPDTFSTLVDFVVLADLVDALSTTQGITLFAPTNDAFTALADAAPDVVANLQTEEWFNHLQDLLLYHVLPAEVPSSAVTDGLTSTALSGEDLSFDVDRTGIFVNSGSQVVVADVDASNGVVHAINNVLLPSWVTNNIVDRAIGSPILTTLVDLVVGAGLAETLSIDGPFTVFAPTDDAFLEFFGDDADTGSLDNDLVTSILTYHVVPGIYAASDIVNGLSLRTLQGEILTFSVMGANKMVNGEGIVSTDILANNGIVHVIDGVLLPNEATASVVMEAALQNSPDQSLVGLNGSLESSSGHRTKFAATTVAILGFGVAIGLVF